MLRIAQCTDSFLPVADGIGRVAYEYAAAIGERGHECYVITPFVNAGYRGNQPFEIVDFIAVQKRSLSPYRAGTAALDLHYLSRADGLKLDVVHSHSPGIAGMEAVRLAERLRVPLIGTFHARYFDDYMRADSGSQYARLALDYYNRCDEVWTEDAEAALLLSQIGVECPIEVFETGVRSRRVPEREIARTKRLLHIDARPVLLCVGRLERAKDLPKLLDMAKLLTARGVAFQLLFVGGGPEEDVFRSQVFAEGLTGSVRLLGQIADPAELDALYALSALCLFPWQSVAAGLPVNEAAGQQTPSLVIRDTASARSIINGVNGVVCEDSAQAMADAAEAFLSNPAGIALMGENASRTVPVTWDAVMDRVLMRYEYLAGMDRARLVRKRGPFRKELQQVDQSLQKRTIDVMWKFLTQDNQHIYAYPYRRSKQPPCALGQARPLPRSTPEAEGVPSGAIQTLVDAINADSLADAHGIMVLRHGKVIAEGYWKPYAAIYPHQLYSLSKSVTATAVGMLVDEGRLSIDEALTDIFSENAPAERTHPVYSLTVRNLLNMSTGSLFNEAGSALGADWVDEFMRAGVKFPAGTAFDYNSMNTYILASVVRRKTGQTLTEYLTPRLFEPLGIAEHEWETAPDGTEKGGWGLMLTLESVAKLGQLYLNGGVWTVDGEEKRLLSREWVAEATRPQIDTPNGEITYGYGHQVWMTSHPGAFLFNGAFGQYMLALPDCDAVVALFSGTSRLFAQGGVLDDAVAAFREASDTALPPDTRAEEALRTTCAALSMRFRPAFYDPDRTEMPFSDLLDRLDMRVYAFDPNVAGLLPVVLASVENNFPAGIRSVAFRRNADVLCIEFSEGETLNVLRVAENGYTESMVRVRDDVYTVQCGAQTEALSSGEWMLHLHVHFVETPCARILHFLFKGDAVTLILDEYPTQQAASEMLLELMGVTRQQVIRSLLPLLKREQLQHRLKTFMTTTLQGKL